jgi:hypothetical protein
MKRHVTSSPNCFLSEARLHIFPMSSMNSLRFPLLLSVFFVSCLGTPGGHFSENVTGLYRTDGICTEIETCLGYRGTYVNGGCPFDTRSIQCCVIDPCRDTGSYCTWTSGDCDGAFLHG